MQLLELDAVYLALPCESPLGRFSAGMNQPHFLDISGALLVLLTERLRVYLHLNATCFCESQTFERNLLVFFVTLSTQEKSTMTWEICELMEALGL